MKLFVNGKEWVTRDEPGFPGERRPRIYQMLSPRIAFWGPLRRVPKEVSIDVQLGEYCIGPTVSTVMTWAPWTRDQTFALPPVPTFIDRQGFEWRFVYNIRGRVHWTAVERFLDITLAIKETDGKLNVKLGGSVMASIPSDTPLLEMADMAKESAISEMQRRCLENQIVRPTNVSRFELLK